MCFADNFVSYSALRLMSAGKLALRGVHADAVPYNMSKLADSCRFDNGQGDGTSTFSTASPFFGGFAPSVVYNPDRVNLLCLVCCEWRCKFDPTKSAQAGHSMHKPSTDNQRHQAIQNAMRIGCL